MTGTSNKIITKMNNDLNLDPAKTDIVLNKLASPFSYETGFYFDGQKTYHWKPCSLCTILGGCYLFISFFVLMGPVITGKTVYSELTMRAFTTPADVPMNDTSPSALSQFFGRKYPKVKPQLNLDNFIDQ